MSGGESVKRAQTVYRFATAMAWGLSIGILVISYVAIAIYIGTPWLWFEIVHESGDRTLLATIFFFEHTARELPLDMILGAAVAAAALFAMPRGTGGGSHRRPDRLMLLVLGLVLATTLSIGGTLYEGGFPMLYENLMQFPTRPGAPPEWGGHWRYHLLSHVMLMAVAFGLGGVLVWMARGASGRGHFVGVRVFRATVVVFTILTIVFIPNLEPFVDPVVIGHQLRESLTHAIVTIPVAFGVCLFLGKDQWSRDENGTVPIGGTLAIGIVGVLAGAFLLISGVARSAASQGQSQSLAVLLFPHFFEHTFSYLVAGLTAGVVFERGHSREGR
jgi:hypothetical protein